MSHSFDSLSINGFEMYYEIYGEGTPLLIIHGFTGSGAGLGESFKQLSLKHKLIIPDLRGHGRSTNPAKIFSFKQAARDVIGLLHHLKITKCSGLGFSGGGCTLLQIAYMDPELISSMALVSATPYFPEQTRAIMQEFSSKVKTAEEWQTMRSMHRHGDEQIELLWKQASTFDDNDMNFSAAMLNDIKTKTLIVQGDRDPLYPLKLSLDLYKHIPNAYLWIIPNGGHVPISATATPEFEGYIEKFLSW